MNFLFIYLGEKKGGGALVYVYVLEHRVSLNYRIAWWLFTKLGRDKVLMTPPHLYWLLGKIRPGVDPGQGHNSSMRGLLQRTSSYELEDYNNKLNIYQWSKSIWEEVLIYLVPFWCLVFDTFWCRVLNLVISTFFLSNIFMGQNV